ncbi:cation diffusion facilitator family transporter [Marinicella sp. W31]|uniref:cation diffusion facilitator family transporter n=1 Tax=Marinicella sp. W31 TaxID=3023713 RepID=UPI0037581C17
MNKVNPKEKIKLKFSLLASGIFVLLALIFGLITNSSSILFDGVYSLISFSMALLTLKIAMLLERPNDETFHFGYAAVEPTLNLFKSLIIIATCVYAVFGAINQLLSGGSEARYGLAIMYGLTSTLGCFIVYLYLMHTNKEHHTDLIRVDAKAWFVDSVLSAAILIGFVSAWILENNQKSDLAKIIDPVVLIILGTAALIVPAKLLLESLREVILKAPKSEIVDNIERVLADSLSSVPFDSLQVRVSKLGREIYLLAHIIVAENFEISSINDLDMIRRKAHKDLMNTYPLIVVDLIFIRDSEFAT